MNTVWALDFMRDTLYDGRVFRTLNVIDEANRGALGIDIATSIPAVRVTAFVAQLIDLHGRPRAIRCDNVLNANARSSRSNSDPGRAAAAGRHLGTAGTAINQWSSAFVRESLPDHSGHKIQRQIGVIFIVPKTA